MHPWWHRTPYRGDVRMIQQGEYSRFALKTREPIGVVGERPEHDWTAAARARRFEQCAHLGRSGLVLGGVGDHVFHVDT
jgi:hypothetical protein